MFKFFLAAAASVVLSLCVCWGAWKLQSHGWFPDMSLTVHWFITRMHILFSVCATFFLWVLHR